MRIKPLQKVILITFFIANAILIELFSRYTINFGSSCHVSFFKIEILSLILIGFFFSFKYSFFINLFYLLIHYFFETIILEYFLESLEHHSHSLFSNFDFFFYIFFLPYISCSLSGLFYQKDLQHLDKKRNIILILLLITLVNILSVVLFTYRISSSMLEEYIPSSFMKLFFGSCELKTIYLIYRLISILVNNLIIGIMIYIMMPRLKENLMKLL